MRKIGYVAVDRGAKLTLQALADGLAGRWLGFDDVVRAQDIELLICGTSDTMSGRALEADARIAASLAGVPCVVIEDFPGNYVEVPEGRPRILFVESEFAARLARVKSGDILAIHVCPAVRYDALRRRLGVIRGAQPSTPGRAVLWIGQPETADSLETLKRLLPALAARAAALWFRAHPRDEGYGRGAYQSLLNAAGLVVEDLTSNPLADVLTRRPTLVVTQFSSVAIEAGFWGICGLNVLFADLGGKTLAAKKGYAVPPWCDEGAAFLIVRQDEVEKVLDAALSSNQSRSRVMRSFDRYFSVHAEGSRRLINVLYNQGLL